MLKVVSRVLLLSILLVVLLLVYLVYSNRLSLLNRQQVSTSFSQFISLQGEDEYVLATLQSAESFSLQEFRKVAGMPVGDTQVSLSLVAHYKYYIRMAEIKQHLDKDNVWITVPQLHLSSPVAFDIASLSENGKAFAFGPDKNVLMQQLKQKAGAELLLKGNQQKSSVYDKAAKSLADNLNQYFVGNGLGGFYKTISVQFAAEKSGSIRQFSYHNSLCGAGPCRVELDVGNGKMLVIP